MENNKLRIALGVVLGLVLASGLFGAGITFGQALPALGWEGVGFLPELPLVVESTEPPAAATGAPPETREELFAPFWEAWNIVHEEYVDPVDDLELMRGAIRGMLDAIGDPHTGYMNPDEFRQANIPLEGEYEGIGA
ncbi:MAG: hypothetical protein GWO24_23960, partial [Akkermansiaceae bacterium]|nr:hypothetical protein [Akkermansiaceae bacterium]